MSGDTAHADSLVAGMLASVGLIPGEAELIKSASEPSVFALGEAAEWNEVSELVFDAANLDLHGDGRTAWSCAVEGLAEPSDVIVH